jgi:AcrR family transcriptional regulator
MTTKIGLRERKKRSAMRRIQEVALDLFDERGFENVTIEQIAEAAEVSPSSVYRYFGTKEQVVLRDDFDVQFFEAVEAELATSPPSTRSGGQSRRSWPSSSSATTTSFEGEPCTPMRSRRYGPRLWRRRMISLAP